jgi:glycine hydroxymethyltransferase
LRRTRARQRVTTRGMKEPEMKRIGFWIAEVLKDLENESAFACIRSEVEKLTEQFPLYEKRRAAVASKAS